MYSKIYSDHDKLGNVWLLDLPPLQLDVDISESTNQDEVMSLFELNKFCFHLISEVHLINLVV